MIRALRIADEDREKLADAIEILLARNESLAEELDDARREARATRQQLASTELWLRELESSRTWRMTSPIRSVSGALRRTRAGDDDAQHSGDPDD